MKCPKNAIPYPLPPPVNQNPSITIKRLKVPFQTNSIVISLKKFTCFISQKLRILTVPHTRGTQRSNLFKIRHLLPPSPPATLPHHSAPGDRRQSVRRRSRASVVVGVSAEPHAGAIATQSNLRRRALSLPPPLSPPPARVKARDARAHRVAPTQFFQLPSVAGIDSAVPQEDPLRRENKRRQIEAAMADRIYLPSAELVRESHCKSMEQYKHMHER